MAMCGPLRIVHVAPHWLLNFSRFLFHWLLCAVTTITLTDFSGTVRKTVFTHLSGKFPTLAVTICRLFALLDAKKL